MINASRTTRHWYEIRSGNDVNLETSALAPLAQVPGVRVTPRLVALPASTWHLPVVQSACNRLGLTLPTFVHPAARNAWVPQGSLYTHQHDGIDFLVNRGGGLLGDQPGLGKTRTAIVSAMTMSPDRPKVVIAPKFTRASWLSELEATGAANPADVVILEGRDVTKSATWRRDAQWYFLHFDVAEAWASRLGQLRIGCAIVDEAHFVRTPSAKRTKGTAAAVLTAQSRIVMTGTPLANKPVDLWQLLVLAHGQYTWGSHLAYRQRYVGAINTGYGWQDIEPSNTGELQSRLETVYMARTIQSAGVQLPSRTRQPFEVDLTETERRDPLLDLDEYTRQEIIQAILTGRVSSGVFKLLHKLRAHTSRGKVSASSELITSLVEQGEPVVVFTHERATARALATKTGGTLITGEDNQDARDLSVAAWRHQCRVGSPSALIATYGALGVGVTLTEARYAVLHDLDWVPSTILQAEARVHRISQTRPTTIYWMTAKDSIDSLFARVLLKKASYLDTILQDDEARDAFTEAQLSDVLPSFEEDLAEYVDSWTRLVSYV